MIFVFFEQLAKLCKQNEISVTSFVKNELGMSTSNVTNWKEGKVPKSDVIQKIAAYFHVSADYLLGTDPTGRAVPETELEQLCREFSPEEMEKLTEYACFLKAQREKGRG